jgi:4-amino-4-deoxy-L-arabinose transferase-like glycosyltransferase
MSINHLTLYKGLWLAAALSLFTTLTLPYIGEESIYAVTSQEMCFYQSWFRPLIYGGNYGRPPLYNWLIILLTQWLGLEHVLLAARIVSSMMTIFSSALLYFLVCRLSLKPRLGLLTVSIFLSGDLLMRRGWLAYSDPTYAFFCLSACGFLWLAVHEQRCRYLLIAFLSVNAAFLTKAVTGYVFFVGTLCILWSHKPYRLFLLKPRVLKLQIGLHILSLGLPLAWQLFSGGSHGTGVWIDIKNQFILKDFSAYLRNLIIFPVNIWCRFFPTSLILSGALMVKNTADCKTDMGKEALILRIALGIFLLNILPYWLAPKMRIRYILPLYPFIAIVLACGVWHFRKVCLRWVTISLWATVFVRVVAGIFWFPYYQKHHRGDNQAVAADLVALAGHAPIYTNYGGAIGVSVAAYANTIRLSQGKAPVASPEAHAPKGLMLSHIKEYAGGDLIKTYLVGREPLYLFAQH